MLRIQSSLLRSVRSVRFVVNRNYSNEKKEEKKGEIMEQSDEPKYEITDAEKKFKNTIAEMKNVQGHIVKQGGGKYTIEYPELTDKQNQINSFLREQANQKIKEIDDALSQITGEEEQQEGFWGKFLYWFYSAEFASFICLTVLFSYIFTAIRYSLDRYYLQYEIDELDNKYKQRINDLEDELIELNRMNYNKMRKE